MICQLRFLEKDRFECFLELASFHTSGGHEVSKHTLNIPRQISAQLGKVIYNNSAVVLQGTRVSEARYCFEKYPAFCISLSLNLSFTYK